MAEVADADHFACVNAVNAAALALGVVEPLKVYDMRGGKWHVLAPTPDLTPCESAALSVLLFRSIIANQEGKALDWMAYVREHGLARHFKP